MKTEFIITVETEENGECLLVLAGNTRERAEEVLADCESGAHGRDWCRKQYPNEKFSIREIESSRCWWNDPVLAN